MLRRILGLLVEALKTTEPPPNLMEEVYTQRILEWQAADEQRRELELAEMLRQAACAERYQRGEAEWVS